MKEIKIPDRLKPENIMDTMEEMQKKEMARKKLRHRKIIAGLAAAAVLVLCIGGAWSVQQMVQQHTGKNSESETEGIQNKEIHVLSNYDILYRNHKEQKENDKQMGLAQEDILYTDTAEDSDVATSDSIQSDRSYSKTNVQTEGVDEGDIIKTDGEYIYYLNEDTEMLEIVKADGAGTELMSEVDIPKLLEEEFGFDKLSANVWIGTEMYLWEDTIILSASQSYCLYDDCIAQEFVEYDSSDSSKPYGVILLFDVSDKKQPEISGFYRYEGSLYETRMTEDILYIVTQNAIDYTSKKTIPACINGEQVPANKVWMTEEQDYFCYTCVVALNPAEQLNVMDYFVYTSGYYPELYMSQDNMYLYSEIWDADDGEQNTCLMKIAAKSGILEYQAGCKLTGYIQSQFSVDEYQGYLRLVVTDSVKDWNNLYIYDENLQLIGKIEEIAEGEDIKSARFDGETGYFVTYRQTDPLFCVDLSNPEEPQILGYLEIPGYSSYLQKVDENTLIGFGYGDNFDVKVSLFDTENPEEMVELQTIAYVGCDSDATYNHKALLYSDEKKFFGFNLDDYYTGQTEYVVLQYDNGTITEAAKLILNQEDSQYEWNVRGVYCGDYLYVLSTGKCQVYSLDGVLSGNETGEIAVIIWNS